MQLAKNNGQTSCDARGIDSELNAEANRFKIQRQVAGIAREKDGGHFWFVYVIQNVGDRPTVGFVKNRWPHT